jgi:hypothetical protein
MKKDYYRSLYFKTWIEDEVVHFVYTTDVLTPEIAKQAVSIRLDMYDGLAYPILTDIRAIKSVDTEARRYLADQESNQLITAGALLVNNHFHKVAGNIFVMVNKPTVPAKLFTSEGEALAWLQRYKNIRSTA